jgi:hypothetical protein
MVRPVDAESIRAEAVATRGFVERGIRVLVVLLVGTCVEDH